MSQLPQNNESFDNTPAYAKFYQANNSVQSDADDADGWGQPASELPPDGQRAQAGKRAANLSLLFGFLGPLFFFLGCWRFVQGLVESALQVAILAPILNILGLWQGFAAKRRGVRASGSLILNGLELCIFIGVATLILLILEALFGLH